MKLAILFLGVLFAAVNGSEIETYIVGGEEVDYVNDAPFMLSLRQNTKHICGAVVIDNKWGLTTADCVRDPVTGMPKRGLNVRAGSLSRENGGYVQKIRKLKVNPNYNSKTGEYNFAMFQVAGAFPESCTPVKLANCLTEPEADLSATIYGWGKDDAFGKHSEFLQKGNVYIRSRRECRTLSIADQNALTSNAKFICAVGDGVATCPGDEGGPLIVEGVMVGLATTKHSCGDPYNPSIFGNIGFQSVRIWIDTARR